METFNKNWLAIILIVLVFTSIGFLLGWNLKPSHHKKSKHSKEKHFEKFMENCEKSCIPLGDDLDSLENIEVEVTINGKGDVLKVNQDTTKTRTVVKKVIIRD